MKSVGAAQASWDAPGRWLDHATASCVPPRIPAPRRCEGYSRMAFWDGNSGCAIISPCHGRGAVFNRDLPPHWPP